MNERYAFVNAEKASHKVITLCRVLDVSRSGFYDWLRRKPSRYALENARFIKEIRQIFANS